MSLRRKVSAICFAQPNGSSINGDEKKAREKYLSLRPERCFIGVGEYVLAGGFGARR
jgi:hypothetical protein